MADDSLSGSRQEAVQPSLWDRLVDELPGIVAETTAMRAELAKLLTEPGQLDSLDTGGLRAAERLNGVTDDTRLLAHRYARLMARRRFLEDSGILVNADVLREAVRRDIEMLFNIERMEADILLTDREAQNFENPSELLAGFPEVRSSVLNYGVPSFAGRLDTSFETESLARELKTVINNFEPRLKPDTVRVKVHLNRKTGMRIEIDGVLMLSPVPERLRLSTSINLDSGQAATTLEEV